MATAVGIMYGLVLDDGAEWGEVAIPHQVEDVEAIFDRSGPNKHFITRPRGGSKTTDLAGVAVSWLASEAPARSRGYVVANNADQSGILIDAAASLIVRTPALEDALVIENERILNPETGAWVRVLTQSDSGAWGLRDAHILILDEFAQWPEVRGAKRVYTAVRTTVQKVKGCKLVILTSAGEPSHWSYTEVFKLAKGDPKGWRVSEMPGPIPWQSQDELEALARELSPSQYERLVLNIWAEDEDRAISPDDYEAAAYPSIVTGGGRNVTLRLKDNSPQPGTKYHIFVDIGTVSDATVMVVAHKEPLDGGGARLIVDSLDRWQGSKKRPVQLSEVEAHLVVLSAEWNHADITGDPTQFVGTMQNLKRHGLKVKEFIFGATSVGHVATALVQTFRNRLAVIPDAEVLKDELLRVKLRESSPGVARLDHDRSGHDDQAVCIGMAAHELIGQTGYGAGAMFKQHMEALGERRGAETPAQRKARREEAAFQRHLRTMTRRRDGVTRRKEREATRCQHRWRDGMCVYGCGTAEASQWQ